MSARRWWRRALFGGLAVVVLFATVRLTRWPETWFDEGSHLHVPMTLVRAGLYADQSSEGFRYFGPSIGVGPTVVLPIAASFRAFGVGLLQARAVMAVFLVAFVIAMYHLGRGLGGRTTGLVAAALLVSMPTPAVFEYGRQVIGEVPGGMFLAAGLLLWGRARLAPTWPSLAAAGAVLGLACVTKHVYLLALAPAMLAAWGLDLAYYRTYPSRVFVVPGAVCAALFLGWQVVVLGWIPPGGLIENWTLLRETSSGAAFVFDPATSRASLLTLVGGRTSAGLLVPALIYTGVRALRRDPREQLWGVIWLVTMANLAWFVVASTGWTRYAFVGASLSAVLVARLWRDTWRVVSRSARGDRWRAPSLRAAMAIGLVGAIAVPLLGTGWRLLHAPPVRADEVAGWLTLHAPPASVVETWEPELGVFSDHRYHYPPPSLLIDAVAYKAGRGPSPATRYAFRDVVAPDYVVVGEFARWVGLYASADLRPEFEPVHRNGAYVVWQRRAPAAAAPSSGSTR